jgi:hypothetical protein
MSTDVVLFDANTSVVSSKFAGLADQIADDLSAGVGGGFAVLSIKGSRFRVKYQGQEHPILDDKGDPVGSIEAVIIKSNDVLTKQYYTSGFVEGSSEAPVCFSLDGKVPSPQSPQPQHTSCAVCPKNAFGSKINAETGKKSKACQDNRKLAIVPLLDLKNELFGGPMLLRIPAAALKDLAMFGDTLKARGYPYNAVAVRIGFDISVSYPKPIFKAIRVLNDAEADQVLEWYQSDAVQKILADFDADIAPTSAEPPKDELFEQPPPAAAAPPPPPPPAPKPAAKPVATPPPPPSTVVTGVQFGKKPAPAAQAAAPPPAQVKAPPKAKPAQKPAAAPQAAPAPTPAPAPVEAAAEAEAEPEVVPGNLEQDISSILEELNGIAGQ